MPSRNNRPSNAVLYRRRRIFFGSAALLVIALGWWAVSSLIGFVGGMFTPAAAPTAATNQVAGAPCATGTVQVIAGIGDQSQTSSTTFAKAENPFIWFSITNNGTVACTFDAGSAVSFYTITSGSETIWDSHDCDRSQDTNAVVTLQPGETKTSGASTWLRVYSSSTGCSTGQKPTAGGGASYHLQATVGDIVSNDVQFVLN
jgi:hypothetical protein